MDNTLLASLGHDFFFLCLSKLSLGIFEQLVGWENKKNSKSKIFFPYGGVIFFALSKQWSAFLVVHIVSGLCL